MTFGLQGNEALAERCAVFPLKLRVLQDDLILHYVLYQRIAEYQGFHYHPLIAVKGRRIGCGAMCRNEVTIHNNMRSGSTKIRIWTLVFAVATQEVASRRQVSRSEFDDEGEAAGRLELAAERPSILDTLMGVVPPNPFAAAAQGELLPLIFFSILFGAALSMIAHERRETVLDAFRGFDDGATCSLADPGFEGGLALLGRHNTHATSRYPI
jgi:hypothetical protein